MRLGFLDMDLMDAADPIGGLVRAGLAQVVLPTTDTGYRSYDVGRLMLPGETNYSKNPACATTKWGTDAAGAAYTRETAPPVALPLGFVACTKIVHSSGSDQGFDLLGGVSNVGPGYGGATEYIAVSPGDVVTVSYYLHAAAVAGGDFARISLQAFQDAAWVRTVNVGSVSAANAGFVRVSGSITIAGSGENRLYVFPAVGAGTGTYYVTGGQIEKSSILTPYFDGSYPDAYWSGTVDASTSVRAASVLTGYPFVVATGSPFMVAVRTIQLGTSAVLQRPVILQPASGSPHDIRVTSDEGSTITRNDDATYVQVIGQTMAAGSARHTVMRYTPTTCDLNENGTDSAQGSNAGKATIDIATLDLTDPTYGFCGYIGPVLAAPVCPSQAFVTALQANDGALYSDIMGMIELARRYNLQPFQITPLQSDSRSFLVTG